MSLSPGGSNSTDFESPEVKGRDVSVTFALIIQGIQKPWSEKLVRTIEGVWTGIEQLWVDSQRSEGVRKRREESIHWKRSSPRWIFSGYRGTWPICCRLSSFCSKFITPNPAEVSIKYCTSILTLVSFSLKTTVCVVFGVLWYRSISHYLIESTYNVNIASHSCGSQLKDSFQCSEFVAVLDMTYWRHGIWYLPCSDNAFLNSTVFFSIFPTTGWLCHEVSPQTYPLIRSLVHNSLSEACCVASIMQ